MWILCEESVVWGWLGSYLRCECMIVCLAILDLEIFVNAFSLTTSSKQESCVGGCSAPW